MYTQHKTIACKVWAGFKETLNPKWPKALICQPALIINILSLNWDIYLTRKVTPLFPHIHKISALKLENLNRNFNSMSHTCFNTKHSWKSLTQNVGHKTLTQNVGHKTLLQNFWPDTIFFIMIWKTELKW